MKIEAFQRKNREQIFQIKNGRIPMLRYPLFDELGIVDHGFTTREGGVSKGCFSTLNLSYARGNERESVDENFRRVAEAMDASVGDFVLSDQTHTTNIRIVTKADCGKGTVREQDYRDVDGLVTNERGIVLGTFYADCVPLFFVDPIRYAIGLSHSGWRGTIGGMGARTIEIMGEAYGCRPQDLYCAIGPSICQNCYEVSEDVAGQFLSKFPESGRELCYPTIPGKYQLNLWEANRLILIGAGILPEHLAVTNICTCCNEKLLFSHRASHGKRGNLGAFLKLKEKIG